MVASELQFWSCSCWRRICTIHPRLFMLLASHNYTIITKIFLLLDNFQMHDAPPPYPGVNPSYTPSYPAQSNGFNGQQPPLGFAGGAANLPPSYGSSGFVPQAPGTSYPNLPPNGFQQPGASAPQSKLNFISFQNRIINFLILVTKEQEAAASAYYDPRAPNSAFVQQPQFYESPPSYSEVDHKKQN